MACPICIESFNKVTRKESTCNYCNYSICRGCLQHYLLTTTEDPHCMNCKKKWNRETMDELVTKNFRNTTFRQRREKLLLEREKALLPATQAEALRTKRIRELNARRRELMNQQRDINDELLALQHGNRNQRVQRAFTIHCPKEDCRGYVSAGDWRCGTCDSEACNRCFELKEEGHECKPENIETAKTLRNETRSCPSCSTLIYKISGCAQMWCTQCHTAFDWTTGQAVSGTIHNPHFYEWQQRTGGRLRAEGDIPCGGLPDIYRFRHHFFDLTRPTESRPARFSKEEIQPLVREIYDIHMQATHIQMVDIPANRVNNNDNQELRIAYLLNEITEDQFKQKLQQKEKQRSKKRELHDVYEMYVFTMVDLFNNLMTETSQPTATLENIKNWLEQVKQLKVFANEQFIKIGSRYNCMPVIIK